MATPLILTSPNTPKRLSAACQLLVTEEFDEPGHARVLIRSTLADPELWPVIGLHKCNGVSLTPSGLYADMAATVAQYIWKKYRGYEAESPGVKVFDLDVDKPLLADVPQKDGGQWIEMESILEPRPNTTDDVRDGILKFKIRSIKGDGSKLADLAHCSATFGWWPGWLDEWSHYDPIINSNIAKLTARMRTESTGQVQHVYRDKAYGSFRSFVDYGDRYQNMAEVVFDSRTLEATALIEYRTDLIGSLVGPYYLDGSCHLSGFVCNAVEEDKDKNAYISHGLDSMRISPTFNPSCGTEIRTYVRMETLPQDKTVLSGDVYVLQDGHMVGIWEGVKFKRIPRKVLNVFLPPPKK